MFDESFRTILFVNPARLSLKNSNLFVQRDGFDDVSLPLNDIAYIILESPCITLSSALLSKLASSKTILLTCDDSHIINGIFNPYLTHFEVNKIIKLQVSQGDAQKSILWQRIIKSKISNQAKFISLFDDKISENLMILQKRVKLSDSQNCEANAAAIYFKALFGKDFTRDDLCFINSALNYVYSIIRACLVRDIVSSGLLPNFGLWHDSVYNQFNLADDLMEPFMRVMVMFDIPVKTKDQIKRATNFRSQLIKRGYFMMQFSVYMRVVRGMTSARAHIERLKGILPPEGNIRLLSQKGSLIT